MWASNLKELMIFRAIGMAFSFLFHLLSAGDRSARALDEVASNLEKSATNYSAVSDIDRETTFMEAKAKAQARRLKAEAKLAKKAKQLEAES